MNKMYQELAKDTFPFLIRMSSHMTNPDWEREFLLGINVLLSGFTANLKNDPELK